jgi:hypothetical protein
MTSPDRWVPDAQLIASYLTGRRPGITLSPADRAWVVAGLTLANKTADDIAERLGCSLRLVRAIRADPMTQLCMFYQQESANFDNELRLKQSEITNAERENAALLAELGRTRNQLGNLIGPKTFPKCGHPKDRYNTYRWTDPRTGKVRTYCRTCHCRNVVTSRTRPPTRTDQERPT